MRYELQLRLAGPWPHLLTVAPGQAFTSILAGYETTANAITFAIYCLATNPDKQTKMLEDIDAFGKRKPQYADLEEGFPYVHAVVQETLRLYPPAPFTTREAVQDQVLAGAQPICAHMRCQVPHVASCC